MLRIRANCTVPAALASGCLLALTACSAGGSTGPATPSPAAAATSGARVTSSGPAPASSPAAARSTPAAGGAGDGSGITECSSAQLRIGEGQSIGATGHSGTPLSFTDVSRKACFVQGYPGVAAATAGGHVVVNAVRTQTGFLSGAGHGVSRIVLRPGQSAYALIEAVDFPAPTGSACPGRAATSLLVTAPDQKASTPVPDTFRICSAFEVHPVISATTYHRG